MGYPAIVFTDFIGHSDRLVASGWGISIGWTYLVWMSIILALWPVSAWFARLRERRRNWWLSYLSGPLAERHLPESPIGKYREGTG